MYTAGFEPAISCVSSKRFPTQLCVRNLVDGVGVEPTLHRIPRQALCALHLGTSPIFSALHHIKDRATVQYPIRESNPVILLVKQARSRYANRARGEGAHLNPIGLVNFSLPNDTFASGRTRTRTRSVRFWRPTCCHYTIRPNMASPAIYGSRMSVPIFRLSVPRPTPSPHSESNRVPLVYETSAPPLALCGHEQGTLSRRIAPHLSLIIPLRRYSSPLGESNPDLIHTKDVC